MTASTTHTAHRHRPPDHATVIWMGSPLAALLALFLVAPQARAAGPTADDLPQAVSGPTHKQPALPVRVTATHGGRTPSSEPLRLADLRDPFAPSNLSRQLPPSPYPVLVADLKDPFAGAVRGARSGGRPLIPGDLRDPFRPRRVQDDAQPGTLSCWPPVSPRGVIIQRPESLREHSTSRACEPADEGDTNVPDLRNPFPVRVPPPARRDHQPPLPALPPTPVARV